MMHSFMPWCARWACAKFDKLSQRSFSVTIVRYDWKPNRESNVVENNEDEQFFMENENNTEEIHNGRVLKKVNGITDRRFQRFSRQGESETFMDVNTQVTGWKKYRSVVRRNFVSVFFPVFVASCIFLDWNRTQRFKKQRTLEAAANSS